MAYVFANDIGGWQGTREREQNRFDVLAQQDQSGRERGIATANEADRFAYQAAARDADQAAARAEDQRRFDLQQARLLRSDATADDASRFNRGLMLAQEGREVARTKLARDRFDTEVQLEKDALDVDKRVSGEEGRLIAQSFEAAQKEEADLTAALKAIDSRLRLQSDAAMKRGLVEGREGFKPSPLAALDPAAVKTAATVNRNIQDLMVEAEGAKERIKRARQLQDRARSQAARVQAYFTPEGMSSASGAVYPFGGGDPAAAPAPAAGPVPGRPVMRFRIENGRSVPIQ